MSGGRIRILLEGGGWGIGGAGCLLAILLATVGLFVRLPDIVPGPAFFDTVVWVLLVLLLAVLLEQVSGLFSPDKVLELDDDLLRVRRGRTVEWERRLPGSSGFHVWHLVEPREDKDRDDDVVMLLIEVQGGMGEIIVFHRDVEFERSDSVRRDFPRWERGAPWNTEGPEEKPAWFQIPFDSDGDRLLKTLLERAGVSR